MRSETPRLPLRVLRLTSAFEAPAAVLAGPGRRFAPIGGIHNHTGCLTRALDGRGLRQHVVTARPPGAPRREPLGRAALVHRLGAPVPAARQGWAWPAAAAASRLAPGVDLIHAHQGEDLATLPVAVTVARRHRLALVVTVHASLRHTVTARGLRARGLKDAGGRVERWGCRRADRVIALTSRLAGLLTADGVPAERTHVVPSGVVPAAFAGRPADPLPGVPHPRVLFVGRVVRQKGVGTLAAAAALVRATDAHFVVVGDGGGRRAFEAAVRRDGLGDRVHLTGFRPHREVPAFMCHADVLVLPSLHEELGSAVLEGMQAGLAIVASDTGGIPEAVGPAALLVPAEDPRALAGAIDRLLGDPGLRRELGAQARERAAAFDWEVLADRVLEVYELALGRPAIPAEAPYELT